MSRKSFAYKLVGAFVLVGAAALILGSFAIQQIFQPDESERPRTVKDASPFDGQRAFEDLARIVAIGTRTTGSPQASQTRAIITQALESAGLTVREHAFEASTPVGTRKMVNLVGVVKGDAEGVIAIGNHYDTKRFSGFEFVGANDGGSTTAWMIEMARTLGPSREGRTIWLCFFDGEEAFEEWSDQDSLYGSRAFLRDLRENGELHRLDAVVNVDMIGDCYLAIYRDLNAPDWLIGAVWETARTLGYGSHFVAFAHNVEDDHLPFREAGIPALNIIDFRYGGSLLDHQQHWHTAKDTLDAVCAESLQTVGDVVYHAIGEIENRLNARRKG